MKVHPYTLYILLSCLFVFYFPSDAMSVESSFYLVDWRILNKKYQQTKTTDFIAEAIEKEEPWLEDFAFDEDSSYPHESWKAMIDFSDWYRTARIRFPKGSDQRVFAFFRKMGCVSDENEKFSPIQELIPEEDEWVFAAISPESTQKLLKDFHTIKIHTLKQPIEAAINEEIEPLIPTFAAFAAYVKGFGKLLKAANDKKRGILVVAQ